MKKSVMIDHISAFRQRLCDCVRVDGGVPGRAGILCLASSSRRRGLQLGNQSRSVHSIVGDCWGSKSNIGELSCYSDINYEE